MRGAAFSDGSVLQVLDDGDAHSIAGGGVLIDGLRRTRHTVKAGSLAQDALLDEGVRAALSYAEEGSSRLVLLTTLTNGIGEEDFFRAMREGKIRDPIAESMIRSRCYVAQADTPRPRKRVSLSRPSHSAEAPVATMLAALRSPSSRAGSGFKML